MAITSVGTLGTGASSTSNSSWTFNTATNTLSSGDVGILVQVTDNISTADGATNNHTSVTGLTGTWTKLGEYTNAPTASAATGVTVSVWKFRASGAVATGSTVTMNLSGNATDKAASFWKFTVGADLQLTGGTTNPITNEVNASNGFGSVSFASLPSAARLYFRGLGKEANIGTSGFTASTNFTAITQQRSRNNSNAVGACGEFRINTSTGETSNPTLAVSGDTAGLFLALEELAPINVAPGAGSLSFTGLAPTLLTTSLGTNLVAYWPLNEASGSALDSTGSYSLTENGTGGIGTTTGKVSGARVFASADQDYFSNTSTDLQVGDTDWTIALWVNMPTVPFGLPVFASKRNFSDNVEFSLFYHGVFVNKFIFTVSDAAGNAYDVQSNFSNAVNGAWYFLVASHDSVNNQISISVNAEASPATFANSAGVAAGTAAFVLGASPNQNLWFDGYLDEAAVWRKVLSQDEIKWLYNNGNGRTYTDFITATGVSRAPAQGTLSLSGTTPSLATRVGVGAVALALSGLAPTASIQNARAPVQGTLTLTGQSTSLATNVGVGSGTLTLTGQSLGAQVHYRIDVAAGTLTVSGLAPSAAQAVTASPGAGTISITGNGTSLNLTLTPAKGALTFTGLAPTASVTGVVSTPSSGTLTLTGQAVSLNLGVSVGNGALQFTGASPTLAVAIAAAPAQGDLTLTGLTPSLIFRFAAAPSAGTLSLSGTSVSLNLTLTPNQGVLSLVGNAPTASTTGVSISPGAGTLTLTGNVPAVNLQIAVAQGDLTLTGTSPSVVTAQNTFSADAGSLNLTGLAPDLIFRLSAQPDAGTLTLTGELPTATFLFVVEPAQGDLVFTGLAPSVTTLNALVPDTGALTLSGQDPTLAFILATSSGTLTLTGETPTLSVESFDINVTPAQGDLTLTGIAPTLDIVGGNVTVDVDSVTLTITGYEPVVDVAIASDVALTPDAGVLTLTGETPIRTGRGFNPDQGALVLNGLAPSAYQSQGSAILWLWKRIS